MSTTPKLGLPYLTTAQAQKEVTHNESLAILDAFCHPVILDLDLTSPPVSPAEGDCYVVASTATGDWTGQDGKLAHYIDAGWDFYDLPEPFVAYIADEGMWKAWDGTNWTPIASITPFSETHTIHPRFPGGVTAAASGSGTYTGTMSEGLDVSGSDYRPHYHWTSSEVALQDFDVAMALTIPEDFQGWQTAGIVLHFATATTGATDNAVDLLIFKNGSGSVGSSTGLVSGSAGAWDAEAIAGSVLSGASVEAGDTLIILCRVYAKDSNWAKVGRIELNWNRV